MRLLTVGLVAVIGPGGSAGAQLTPDRLYYGLDRAIPMTVAAGGAGVEGVEVHLLEAGTASVLEKAPVRAEQAAGIAKVDLAVMFPSIWTAKMPRVVYAQMVVAGKKVGPAVVLQPLVTPAYAPRADRSGVPMFPRDDDRPRVYSGIRAYVAKNIVLETSKGQVTIGLRPEAAPNTCWNFLELVAGGLYTEVLVHRVASLAGKPGADIIQTGDPNGTGQGGPGYFIDLEPSRLPHDFGVVSAARVGDPNSGGSQFFICLNRERTAYLDGRYASFGVVLSGSDGSGGAVVRAIAASPVGADNRPVEPPVIRSARLEDAAPYGEGPRPAADPTRKDGTR